MPALPLLLGLVIAPQQWTRGELPTLSPAASSTLDTTRNRLVTLSPSSEVRTWEWDGTEWLIRSGSGPNFLTNLVYDPQRQRTVTTSIFDDTWEWDGVSWQVASTARPDVDRLLAATFHPGVGKVVKLVTLRTGGTVLWAWDGSAWRALTNGGPTPRTQSAMAFDPRRNRLVLFGGDRLPPSNDTWEWDGTTWNLFVPAQSPPARSGHTMAWDPVRGTVVVIGGAVAGTWRNDMWEWDGRNWQQVLALAAPVLEQGSATTDNARRRIVLSGREQATARFGVWEWDGTRWQATTATLTTIAGPKPAYHVRRAEMLAIAPQPLNTRVGTWRWDRQAWHDLSPPDDPPGRENVALTYDEARSQIVLFGGGSALSGTRDTWLWDGAWTQVVVPVAPQQRRLQALAYDAARQRTVLFGGSSSGSGTYLDDTWEWDGTTWQQRQPTTFPPSRVSHAMVYDAARQRVLLFGGLRFPGPVLLNDLWQWDGTQWTELARGPMVGRQQPALAYDPVRARVLLFGGLLPTGPLNDTWEWDGTSWQRVTTSPSPPAQADAGFVYDPAGQRLFMLPGSTGTTWATGAWHYGTGLVQTEVSHYGAACASGPAAMIAARSTPSIGKTSFGFDCVGLPAAQPWVLGLSSAAASIPWFGCTVLIDPVASLFLAGVANAGGFASIRIPLPLDVNLRGGTLHAQGIWLDAQSSSGIALTRGLRAVIGD